ncbi:MAG: DUF1801 domain-containing protein [Nitrososphaerota archaeon]|nr:DUF1801 domain-containing protein [Nitrososphaerota archaeon]MDG7006262.1 DUF1801 domain-containing protein [Nitrososphaerota archaeon]
MQGSKVPKDVDTYIEDAPEEARPELRRIRAAIWRAAPDAVESISYAMPFYSFRGQSGFGARLCYFGLLKEKKKIALYTCPAFLEEQIDEARRYMTAKSAPQFASDIPIPVQLIVKAGRNGIRTHEAGMDSKA